MVCNSVVHGAGIILSNCNKAPNEGDYTFTGYAELKPASVGGCTGLRLFLDGVDQGSDYTFYGDAFIVSTNCPIPTTQYDCVNGVCVVSATGFYPSLGDCQVACGKKGCSGQCVSSSDWAKIEELVNQIKNRNCL